LPSTTVCRKHGISAATHYQWKSRYGGLEAAELKRMYADKTMETEALRDLIEKKL
jgi:putative transposase